MLRGTIKGTQLRGERESFPARAIQIILASAASSLSILGATRSAKHADGIFGNRKGERPTRGARTVVYRVPFSFDKDCRHKVFFYIYK